jgi:Zn-dependent M28 family amino/carboxypeptidase
VARVCSQLNPRPSLLLVFTGAEEVGLWGARALASRGYLRKEDRILNEDTVGGGLGGARGGFPGDVGR